MPSSRLLSTSLKITATLVAAAALGACAAFTPKTPEQVVAERSQDYWTARIKGDKAKAYSYTHPSYKQVATEKDYALQNPGTFATSIVIEKVECEAEKCDVGLNMKVNPPIIGSKLKEVDIFVSETWLLDQGQWWIYLKP